mmetsp:Transcript_8636/g.18969  ORF Transcript_8636/g.18969 Transcript_8636/m.18969 type:complete len:230 (-) Transcript_8636:221-910(-)
MRPCSVSSASSSASIPASATASAGSVGSGKLAHIAPSAPSAPPLSPPPSAWGLALGSQPARACACACAALVRPSASRRSFSASQRASSLPSSSLKFSCSSRNSGVHALRSARSLGNCSTTCSRSKCLCGQVLCRNSAMMDTKDHSCRRRRQPISKQSKNVSALPTSSVSFSLLCVSRISRHEAIQASSWATLPKGGASPSCSRDFTTMSRSSQKASNAASSFRPDTFSR